MSHRFTMPIDHREIRFEDAIEHHLLNNAGYAKADPAKFDRERVLDPTLFTAFVAETQPEVWESPEKLHGSETEGIVLNDMCKAMAPQGSLAVIRYGVSTEHEELVFPDTSTPSATDLGSADHTR